MIVICIFSWGTIIPSCYEEINGYHDINPDDQVDQIAGMSDFNQFPIQESSRTDRVTHDELREKMKNTFLRREGLSREIVDLRESVKSSEIELHQLYITYRDLISAEVDSCEENRNFTSAGYEVRDRYDRERYVIIQELASITMQLDRLKKELSESDRIFNDLQRSLHELNRWNHLSFK